MWKSVMPACTVKWQRIWSLKDLTEVLNVINITRIIVQLAFRNYCPCLGLVSRTTMSAIKVGHMKMLRYNQNLPWVPVLCTTYLTWCHILFNTCERQNVPLHETQCLAILKNSTTRWGMIRPSCQFWTVCTQWPQTLPQWPQNERHLAWS